MKTALFFRVAVPAALAAAALLSGTASAQSAAASPDDNSTVTREDVMRDLAAWKQAGLENSWSGDSTPDVYSPQYRASYRQYMDTVKPAAAPPVRAQ
ncbi:hypothetical protein A6B37_17885 [Achromobacter sp. HZ01]|uniref:DUF4148 domain-containing protein n=1 Tax=Achromobacter sp. HZ01 TaxID=1416886 RepID=UPI000DC33D2A|nr:DUF4148 domain-containing protein [Achromobacter sp. HZ01]MBO9328717.1 DUF4148 domain-containing protein [Achromobacter xylosoxidans]RAP62032.1 hypothetical protein A6B37_17885 [Achromobacter sp. HZ01]